MNRFFSTFRTRTVSVFSKLCMWARTHKIATGLVVIVLFGASESDISNQFLMESLVLTLIGGAIGIVLGLSIAALVTLTGLLTAVVSLSSVTIAFGVSAVIGISFGWYPARKAARMNPIDALRFE